MIKTLWSKTEQYIRHKITKIKARRWVYRGKKHLDKGLPEEALADCIKALAIYDNLLGAYKLMSKILMPGDDYFTLLAQFHKDLKPENYVEIGVSTGRSLILAGGGTKSIGIDPSPNVDKNIKLQAKLYKIKSDVFFESYNLLKELGSSRLDLVFIDGLHYYDQALKDFINLERYSNKKTIILIHDCLPISRLAALRERATMFWCGDVWKIIPCLMKYRPDLNINIIPARPSGLGIITNLNPESTVLPEKFKQIIAEFQNQELSYEYLDINKKGPLKIISNDWPHIKQILPK